MLEAVGFCEGEDGGRVLELTKDLVNYVGVCGGGSGTSEGYVRNPLGFLGGGDIGVTIFGLKSVVYGVWAWAKLVWRWSVYDGVLCNTGCVCGLVTVGKV